jgi:hypothetical protein
LIEDPTSGEKYTADQLVEISILFPYWYFAEVKKFVLIDCKENPDECNKQNKELKKMIDRVEPLILKPK